MATTKKLSGELQVVAVGDYASTKWDKPTNGPYDIMQSAGYKDPLGNAARSHNSAPGEFVEKRINTSYASLNMYKRQARNFAGDVNGSNTDYIFVSTMRVPEYEVVVKVNSSGPVRRRDPVRSQPDSRHASPALAVLGWSNLPETRSADRTWAEATLKGSTGTVSGRRGRRVMVEIQQTTFRSSS